MEIGSAWKAHKITAATTPPLAWEGGLVLVADDEPLARRLLRSVLEPRGHVVIEAADGRSAVERARSDRPDVVLLDVMMPVMSGFEACRALKADPDLAAIPTLLVTGLSSPEDRAAGMEAGADDFLSKPIDTRTAVLRIRNAVRAKRLNDQVREDFRRLKDLELLRDHLTQMVVHDMRGPLTGIGGYLELLERRTDGSENASRLLHSAAGCTARLMHMVSDLLDVSRLEEGKMPLVLRRVRIEQLAAEAQALLGQGANAARIRVVTEPEVTLVSCDPDLIRRVIVNFASNALKHSPPGRLVEIAIRGRPGRTRLEVRDEGAGIPPEYVDRVFDKFVQVEARKQGEVHSSGLGLTFCKLAVEAHHGAIGVESQRGHGSTFWFELPEAPEVGIAVGAEGN
jgi:signal transduction histidine kinase